MALDFKEGVEAVVAQNIAPVVFILASDQAFACVVGGADVLEHCYLGLGDDLFELRLRWQNVLFEEESANTENEVALCLFPVYRLDVYVELCSFLVTHETPGAHRSLRLVLPSVQREEVEYGVVLH